MSPSPDGTITWRELLHEATARLTEAGLPDPAVDARRLVEGATDTQGREYLDVLDAPATVRALARFDAWVGRRAGGEPLQYVLGRWGFRALDLLVDRRVLIPRPETEIVVEAALGEIDRLIGERAVTYQDRLTVADLGTGSGAIALAMATERPLVDVWATDVSSEALAVARANLAGVGRAAARVRVAEGSWFDALPPDLAGSLGVIVSNPPYVATADALPAEVIDWEPPRALWAGADGLADLAIIIPAAPRWLLPGGALVVECDPRQVPALRAATEAAGFAATAVVTDLAGRDRAVIARLPAGPPGQAAP